jgi:hypothetical protein
MSGKRNKPGPNTATQSKMQTAHHVVHPVWMRMREERERREKKKNEKKKQQQKMWPIQAIKPQIRK